MSNDAVRMQSLGVKCDTEDCGFKVSFGTQAEYDGYLNKPCPVCGVNLLTQEDHDSMKKMLSMVEKANDPEFMEVMMEQMPPEIIEMMTKLENPEAQAKIKIDFIDGMPVMSSEDPEIQVFIDKVTEFYTKQGE